MNRTLVAVTAVASVALCSACTGPVVTGTEAPGCTPDSTVTGCTGSAGFSCNTGATPDQADPSLVCSDGVPGGRGLTLFCCLQFQSSSCGPDPTVQNCPGSSIGFSCTGSQTPEDTDPSLTCGPGALGNAGALVYCCSD
ncbi:MAG: hypothetical protein ACRENE_07425 [Polyangiaceae bacterium]